MFRIRQICICVFLLTLCLPLSAYSSSCPQITTWEKGDGGPGFVTDEFFNTPAPVEDLFFGLQPPEPYSITRYMAQILSDIGWLVYLRIRSFEDHAQAMEVFQFWLNHPNTVENYLTDNDFFHIH